MNRKTLTSEPKPLTPAQERTLAAIRKIISVTAMPPTLEEIGAELGCTMNTARASVRLLEAKGVLTRQPGKYRSIRLTVSAEPKRRAA